MLLDSESYKRCFAGFTITDCAVRDKGIFYFVTLAEYDTSDAPPPDPDRITRVVVCFAEKPADERWRLVSFKGFNGLFGAASKHPMEQFVGVDRDGQVVSFGGGTKEHEVTIPGSRKGPRRGGVQRLRTLDGFVHAATGYRGLARRDDHNRWVSLCDTLDFEPEPGSIPSEYGFDDFDAFDANDIYCVGGQGDVWHRGKGGWRQIEFPSNMVLESVCCGGDGFVYVGAQSGSVWKGRDDTWRLIHRGHLSLPFKDMVWFQDRVYCTNDYGLWEIEGDTVREAAIPDAIKVCCGNLALADGVMLLAGVFGAAYHDGNGWTQLFDTMTFTGPNPPP